MEMQPRLVLVFVLAIVLSATSNSFVAIYKYIDKKGIISVILWGMSGYLIVAHAGDVVHLLGTREGKVDTVQRDTRKRGKRLLKP
jgi:hypothetical protein